MPTPRHLVTVWNPSYTSNAMEAHLGVLLDRIRDWREDRGDEDDIYVWWGKIRSENRQQGMARDAELRSFDADLDDLSIPETQLYLTDYRSLYVAGLERISWEDQSRLDPAHVPAYYRQDNRLCDCWFQLRDIRRLVADDATAVIQELKCLRNVHYHDRPVSLYGGMVDLPLIVTRPDGRHFFLPSDYDLLPAGQLWVEFDAESGGTGAMQRDLRENRFGDTAWMLLDPVSRIFVATAEKVFRDHRNDESFDFQAVLGPLAKAIEVEANARLRAGLANAPDLSRHANVEGHTVDLLKAPPLSLGQLAHVLAGEQRVVQHLGKTLTSAPWFTGQLPAQLDALAQARNPGSHSARVPREVARRWRDQIVGIGCQGMLLELAGVRVK